MYRTRMLASDQVTVWPFIMPGTVLSEASPEFADPDFHSRPFNRATATQSLQQIPSRATRSHDIFVFHQRRDGTLVSSVDYLSEASIPQNPFRPIMSLIIEVIAGSRYRASMAKRFRDLANPSTML